MLGCRRMGRFSGVAAVNLRSAGEGRGRAGSALHIGLLGSSPPWDVCFLVTRRQRCLEVVTGMQMLGEGLTMRRSSDKCELGPSAVPLGQASETQR